MKLVKLLIVVTVLTIVLTGCSAVDTVTLYESGKVKEKVSVRENNFDVQYGNNSLEDSVEEALSEYVDTLNFRDYTSKVVVSDEESGVDVTANYKNMCDFINKTVFTQYVYKRVDCVSDSNYYIIDSVGSYITRTSDEDVWNVPSKMILRIELPFKAIENNADTVNGNTYVWTFDGNTNISKSIHLKISKKSIKQAKDKYDKRKKEVKKNKIIKTFIIAIIVLSLVVGVGYLIYKFLFKKYKENKLDY